MFLSKGKLLDTGQRRSMVMITMGSFSLAPLLAFDPDVPADARASLRAAIEAAPGDRAAHLASAARSLHRATALDCAEARELVGLPTP
jgi:hypothetical protein